MKLDFQVRIKVQKPAADVFDAVVNPKRLSGYFTGSASGPLQEGKQVTWIFPEFPGEVPVSVRTVVPNQHIRLEWDGADEGYNTQVDMKFETVEPSSTSIAISETGWRANEKGVESSYRNCGGWMHMLCCLKAFLEYDINLRKGSF